MYTLFEQLLWIALLAAFGILVKIEEEIERDEALVHAMCKKSFGDIPLAECLNLIRANPSHPLRNVVRWWDSPKRTFDSTAVTYRRSEIALNRAISAVSKDPTIGQMLAVLLAGARFRRDQRAFPLSKPAAEVERNKRVKAAVDIEPEDLSAAAQDAVIELSDGDVATGLRLMASLITQGDPSARHLAAIMVRVEDEEFEGVNRLATRIKRARYAALDKQALAKIPEKETQSDSKTATDHGDQEGGAPEVRAALQFLIDWAERHSAILHQWFVEDDAGQLVFREEIRSPRIRDAYAVAGHHPEFQARLRQLLSARHTFEERKPI